MDNIWYKISAKKLAEEETLKYLNLSEAPLGDNHYDKLFKTNLNKARGVKYGVKSYSEMYMKEREIILGNWENFFFSFCRKINIDLNGTIFVAGVNDGKEIGFLESNYILGVDISTEAIKRGKKLYPNINFINDDIISYISTNDSFNTYIALRTIHFFHNYERKTIICNAYSSLKKFGKILISVPGGFLSEYGTIIFGQKKENEEIDKKAPKKNINELKVILQRTGFKEIKIIDKKIEIFLVGTKL